MAFLDFLGGGAVYKTFKEIEFKIKFFIYHHFTLK